MKTNKFRVWDVKFEDILDADNIMLDRNDSLSNQINDCSDYKFMKFTGMVDKNGLDIYEGDIVKVYQDDDILFEHHVEWSDEGGCYSIFVNHYDYDIITMAWAERQFSYEYEVIGNIYENPELLEGCQ